MYFKGLGPFLSYTQVQTQFTKETLLEMVKELRGVAGAIPLSEEELSDTKKYIMLSYPREFETLSDIAGKLAEMTTFHLPKDYFSRYIPAIENVQKEDVVQAAKQYVHPDSMLFLIVGDIDKIEPGIRELKLGEIRHLDSDGNPTGE